MATWPQLQPEDPTQIFHLNVRILAAQHRYQSERAQKELKDHYPPVLAEVNLSTHDSSQQPPEFIDRQELTVCMTCLPTHGISEFYH